MMMCFAIHFYETNRLMHTLPGLACLASFVSPTLIFEHFPRCTHRITQKCTNWIVWNYTQKMFAKKNSSIIYFSTLFFSHSCAFESCIKIEYAFTKQLRLDAADGEGQVFLIANNGDALVLGGDGQASNNGPLLEVGKIKRYEQDWMDTNDTISAMVRHPEQLNHFYSYSSCNYQEWKLDPENHNMTKVADQHSLFPTALPCPIDAAIFFKKQIHVFRGCKLWSEKGELTHLHNIGLQGDFAKM